MPAQAHRWGQGWQPHSMVRDKVGDSKEVEIKEWSHRELRQLRRWRRLNVDLTLDSGWQEFHAGFVRRPPLLIYLFLVVSFFSHTKASLYKRDVKPKWKFQPIHYPRMQHILVQLTTLKFHSGNQTTWGTSTRAKQKEGKLNRETLKFSAL